MIHIDSGGGVFIIHIDIDNKKEKMPLRSIVTPRHAFPLQLTTNTRSQALVMASSSN